jgi:hypothetical protein
MTSEQFGTLALQLISQASIPGSALDAAIAFRKMARDLAEGRVVLADQSTTEAANDPEPKSKAA